MAVGLPVQIRANIEISRERDDPTEKDVKIPKSRSPFSNKIPLHVTDGFRLD